MNKWFQFEKKSDSEKCRLYCFHYAGGNASFYSNWSKYLSDQISVYPLQFPGRGRRMGEKCFTDAYSAAEAAAEQIAAQNTDVPVIFFGHSMGGVLAYLTAYILQSEYDINIAKLFVSGSVLKDESFDSYREVKAYRLPDKEFCRMLVGYGDIDEEYFRHEEFFEYFLPVLRADFQLVEDYTADKSNKLNCDIEVFIGEDDSFVTEDTAAEWKDYTHGEAEIHSFDGGHFFLKNYKNEICSMINEAALVAFTMKKI